MIAEAFISDGWSIAGGIALVIILCVFIVLPRELRRLDRARAAHVAARSPMADEAFLSHVTVSEPLRPIALAMRNVFADALKVPVATIYPTDTIKHFSELHFDGLDFLDIAFRIERALLVKFDLQEVWGQSFVGAKLDTVTLAELIARFAEHYPSMSPRKA